ncbi:MAG: hypothetical protein KC442_06420 [Thermomicrobiales bacterium]|nr:hypothetical protein [Thermomicrobiales bacterium]
MNTRNLMQRTAVSVAALALFALPAAAQTPAAEGPVEQHPTAIYTGTCDDPGELVADLVSLIEPEGTSVGAADANAVKQGSAVVDMPVTELVSDDHILIATGGPTYAPGRQEEVIACGAIGGVEVDGVLTFGLAPVNASEHVGLATISDQAGHALVTMYIVEYPGSEAFDTAQQ